MISIMEKNSNISVLASSFEFIDQKGDVFTVPLDSRMSNNNLLTHYSHESHILKV